MFEQVIARLVSWCGRLMKLLQKAKTLLAQSLVRKAEASNVEERWLGKEGMVNRQGWLHCWWSEGLNSKSDSVSRSGFPTPRETDRDRWQTLFSSSLLVGQSSLMAFTPQPRNRELRPFLSILFYKQEGFRLFPPPTYLVARHLIGLIILSFLNRQG